MKLVTSKLMKIHNAVSNFYFGTYDLRWCSLTDHYKANAKIKELNGCCFQPAHICYSGDAELTRISMACKPLAIYHIFAFSGSNPAWSILYVTHREAFSYYREFRSAVK